MAKIGQSIDEFEIGMTAEFSHTFTQEETEVMADLIGDHNPFQYNYNFVKRSTLNALLYLDF